MRSCVKNSGYALWSVLTAGGFERLAIFKRAKPLYGQNPDDANNVADMITTDDLPDTIEKPINALLAEMERFRENPRKKALFINLAKKRQIIMATTSVSLLAKMDDLLHDDDQLTQCANMLGELIDANLSSFIDILLNNDRIEQGGLSYFATAITNAQQSKSTPSRKRISNELPPHLNFANAELFSKFNRFLLTQKVITMTMRKL